VEILLAIGVAVNAANKGAVTALHWVAMNKNSTGFLELLIATGADVNAKTNDGKTPLAIALERGHAKVADLLRKHGAVEPAKSGP